MLDITSAVIISLVNGGSPVRMLQGIAGALLGQVIATTLVFSNISSTGTQKYLSEIKGRDANNGFRKC